MYICEDIFDLCIYIAITSPYPWDRGVTLDLVDDQLVITISFKISHPHLLRELKANGQTIVLGYIVGTRLCQRECTMKEVILRLDKYYPHSDDNLAF